MEGTPQVEALFAEMGVPDPKCPPEWWQFGACVVVVVAPDQAAAGTFERELHRYAADRGFVLRVPHLPVSLTDVWNELELARGGILVLDELEDWNLSTIEHLRQRVMRKSIPVTVVGLTHRYDHDPEEWEPTIHSHADALAPPMGAPIIYLDQVELDGDVETTPGLSEGVLETIDRHRAGLGMSPLDPAAGWATAELEEMAERIRATGRMNNPLSALKRRLMPPG